MSKEQIAVAELVLNMILGKTGGTRADYFPQKPDFPFDAPYEQAFERATPESQGISSDLFAALLRVLRYQTASSPQVNTLSHSPLCRLHKV